MAVDLRRTNLVGHHFLDPGEPGMSLAVAYGLVVTDRTSFPSFQSRLNGGARDVCYFLPSRVLVVSPKDAPGLKAMWAGIRGREKEAAQASAASVSLKRRQVRAIRRHQYPPEGWRLLGAQFLQIKGIGRGQQILMWLDTSVTHVDAIDGLAETYPGT